MPLKTTSLAVGFMHPVIIFAAVRNVLPIEKFLHQKKNKDTCQTG